MTRLIRLTIIGAVVGGALISAAGCRHYCGYVDIETADLTVISEATARPAPPLLLIVSWPTAAAPSLKVAVRSASEIERQVRREFRGRAVYTEYHWTCAAKILLPLSLPIGIIMPLVQPHDHGANRWGWGDYGRDFIGWVNPFEAWPSGKQLLADEAEIFRAKEGSDVVTAPEAPIAGVAVKFYRNGKLLAQKQTGADGACSLDLPKSEEALRALGRVILEIIAEIPGPAGAGEDGVKIIKRKIRVE